MLTTQSEGIDIFAVVGKSHIALSKSNGVFPLRYTIEGLQKFL
jgi:hypothetical protein